MTRWGRVLERPLKHLPKTYGALAFRVYRHIFWETLGCLLILISSFGVLCGVEFQFFNWTPVTPGTYKLVIKLGNITLRLHFYLNFLLL